MGISRSGRFKRKPTGGRRAKAKKKRAYERARPASQTKIGGRRVRLVRVRGGKFKLRALRLNHGNFSWRSEQATRKTRIVDVMFHPANNEYIRTKTLTKSAIIQIDATPFRQWYHNHYNVELSKGTYHKLKTDKDKFSKQQINQFRRRQSKEKLPDNLIQQFKTGRLLAFVASKPGQVGRADGYILEGEELDFYQKQIAARHKK